MPGALSYLTVRPPEALSYGAPSVDFSPIGNLNKTAREGEQYARLRSLQEPILDANGQPTTDFDTITSELLKRGGALTAQQLLPTLLDRQIYKDMPAVPGATQGGPKQQQSSVQQPPGSIGTHPYGPEAASAGQPELSSTGVDNKGTESAASLASSVFGDMDATPIIKSVAAKLGVDPADELTPKQINQAKYLYAVEKSKLASTSPNAPISGPQGPPQVAATQPQRPVQTAQTQPVQERPTVTRPGDNEQALKNLDTQLANMSTAAQRASIRPEIAKQIRESMVPIQKQRDEMSARITEQRKIETGIDTGARTEELKKYEDKHEALGNAALEATKERQKRVIAKNIMSDPGYISGFGAGRALNFQRAVAAFDPSKANVAQPQEVMKKFFNDSLRSKIVSLSQSGVGRIMRAEVSIMQSANANQDNSIASNRTLVEVDDRSDRMVNGLADAADKYADSHGGHLDHGWDKVARQYVKDHPMFTEDEMKKENLLAAPQLPAKFKTKAEINDWATKMQLQRNDPVRMPNGEYIYWKAEQPK